MSNSLNGLTRLTIVLSTGVPPNIVEFRQDVPLSDLDIGTNTITISQNIVNQMNKFTLRTNFTVTIETYYSDGLSITESASNYNLIPEPVTTILSMSPINKNFGDSPIALIPLVTTNSSGDFNFISDNPLIATISDGDILNIIGAGTCNIFVLQLALGVYTSAQVNVELVVNPIAPTITTFTITSKNVGASPFTPTYPTSNSSGAFTYTSSNTSVATVHPTTGLITVLNAGTTTITVTQAAAGNYTSGSVQASLVVNPIAPTITTFTITSKNVGASPFTPTYPTSNSSGAFTYTSSNTSVATVHSTTGLITVLNAGTTTVTVTQAAAGNYTSGSVHASLVVNPIAPTYRFNSTNIPSGGTFTIPSKNEESSDFTPTYPTSNSSGAITYTSSNTSVATVNSTTGLINVRNQGTTTIRLSQAAAGNFTSGNVQASLMVQD